MGSHRDAGGTNDGLLFRWEEEEEKEEEVGWTRKDLDLSMLSFTAPRSGQGPQLNIEPSAFNDAKMAVGSLRHSRDK